MQCIAPNTPEQAAMSSRRLLHTALQSLAVGIEEVTNYGPVSSLDCSHILQTFLLCSSMMIAVLEVSIGGEV